MPVIKKPVQKKKPGGCKEKGFRVGPDGECREKGEPRRWQKIQECCVERRFFPEEAFHEKDPGEESAVLEQDGGQAQRKDRWTEKKKEGDGEEAVNQCAAVVVGDGVIKKRDPKPFDQIFGKRPKPDVFDLKLGVTKKKVKDSDPDKKKT
jgi:hypothetical protein